MLFTDGNVRSLHFYLGLMCRAKNDELYFTVVRSTSIFRGTRIGSRLGNPNEKGGYCFRDSITDTSQLYKITNFINIQ